MVFQGEAYNPLQIDGIDDYHARSGSGLPHLLGFRRGDHPVRPATRTSKCHSSLGAHFRQQPVDSTLGIGVHYLSQFRQGRAGGLAHRRPFAFYETELAHSCFSGVSRYLSRFCRHARYAAAVIVHGAAAASTYRIACLSDTGVCNGFAHGLQSAALLLQSRQSKTACK